MRVISVLSTKGGVGKTTTTANLGGLLADAGLRVLLVDLDSQPSLSSYYPLTLEAPGGVYELMALSETRPERIVSNTAIAGLAACTVFIGLNGEPIYALAETAAEQLLNPDRYIRAVLEARP